MDELQARSILGISATATLDDARAAYRAKAKRHHPDTLAGISPDQLARGQDVMGQLNEAWALIQQRSRAGTLGVTATAAQRRGPEFRLVTRPPRPTECMLCGSTPAGPIRLDAVTSIIIVHQLRRFEGFACRTCGLGLAREQTYWNLTRGWWGIGVFTMIGKLFSNASARTTLRRLGMPAYRDPAIVSVFDGPAHPGPPALRRGGTWLASLAAVTLVAGTLAIFATTSTPTDANSPGSSSGTSASDLVGTCWTESGDNLKNVECSDASAQYTATSSTGNPDSCSSVYVEIGKLDYLCMASR